jgi:hypothetical protein
MQKEKKLGAGNAHISVQKPNSMGNLNMLSVEMIFRAAHGNTLILHEYIYIYTQVYLAPRIDIRYEATGSCGLRKSLDNSITEQECFKSRFMSLISKFPFRYAPHYKNELEQNFWDVTP